MSNPPDPPSNQPQMPPISNKWAGALAATVIVVIVMVISLVRGGNGLVITMLGASMMAFLCVIVGSLLTIFERTRQFAVGFLIASAILIFVTTGVCLVASAMGAPIMAFGRP